MVYRFRACSTPVRRHVRKKKCKTSDYVAMHWPRGAAKSASGSWLLMTNTHIDGRRLKILPTRFVMVRKSSSIQTERTGEAGVLCYERSIVVVTSVCYEDSLPADSKTGLFRTRQLYCVSTDCATCTYHSLDASSSCKSQFCPLALRNTPSTSQHVPLRIKSSANSGPRQTR